MTWINDALLALTIAVVVVLGIALGATDAMGDGLAWLLRRIRGVR